MITAKQQTLGELRSFSSKTLTKYSLACFLKKSCIINSTILDQRGVTLWDQNSVHPKGESQITLELPSLAPGRYNCWIKIDGEMHRRPIHISSSKGKKSRISNIMSRFSSL
ncbi:MAG: hypothetical protein AAGJ93_02775 [Bacteroidota bacterium]